MVCGAVSILFNSALGGSHGVPRVHYKGRQGDYYIMVGPQIDENVILLLTKFEECWAFALSKR